MKHLTVACLVTAAALAAGCLDDPAARQGGSPAPLGGGNRANGYGGRENHYAGDE